MFDGTMKSKDNSAPIAIIGMGCRFPGNVNSPSELWDMLNRGQNTWSPTPSDRYNEAAFCSQDGNSTNTHNQRGGHFLSQNIAAFDAGFFDISAEQARAMDPQQRLLLETAFEAVESANIPYSDFYGSNTGVYTATFNHDYDRNLSKDATDIPRHQLTGTGDSMLSNRISYVFNLKGPSMTIDTGCSGGIVAVHQACQSLKTFESDTAVAGGANLILNPDRSIELSNLRMLDPHGRSFSFDSRGNGYGRGEGVACLVLKRLEDAQAAGDPIQAVIQNTALGQDGRTKGITRPSALAQEHLERWTLERAGLAPEHIDFVEAHGTGTPIGDLEELQAISKVYADGRETPLPVGSIKSNIGHLENVSGLAGLIKATLVLQNRAIPPNADFQTPKSTLDLDAWNIKVPIEATSLSEDETLRVAVNSFGYGGTNAHAILETAPDPKFVRSDTKKLTNGDAGRVENPSRLIAISAKSQSSLSRYRQTLSQWLAAKGNTVDPSSLAYTLNSRNSQFSNRFTCTFRDVHDLRHKLDLPLDQTINASQPFDKELVYVFSGQGTSWAKVSRELFYTVGPFQKSLLSASNDLKSLGAKWDLVDLINHDAAETLLREPSAAQAVNTAMQIAIVDLFQDLGLQPDSVIGHSSGEVAAAYAIGRISRYTALGIAFYRGLAVAENVVSQGVMGQMLAVQSNVKDMQEVLSNLRLGYAAIACVNSDTHLTIAGDRKAILELKDQLDTSSITSRSLDVDVGYHCELMSAAAGPYLEYLKPLSMEPLQKQQGVFYSTVTGQRIEEDSLPAEYWVRNLTSQVLFRDTVHNFAMDTSHANGKVKSIFVEISPSNLFKNVVNANLSTAGNPHSVEYLNVIQKHDDALTSLMALLGKVWEQAFDLKIKDLFSLYDTHQVPRLITNLPSYSWDHDKTYWHESRISRAYRFLEHPYHDLLGIRDQESTINQPVWRHRISLSSDPWINDHKVNGLVVFPGAGFLSMVIEGTRQLFPNLSATRLDKVHFYQALVISDASSNVEVRLTFDLLPKGTTDRADYVWQFRISSSSDGDTWLNHCDGLIDSRPSSSLTLRKLVSKSQDGEFSKVNPTDVYGRMRGYGNDFGPEFQHITEFSHTNSRVLARSRIHKLYVDGSHTIHPTILDSFLQPGLLLYTIQHGPTPVMPTFIERLVISHDIKHDLDECFQMEISSKVTGKATSQADILARGTSMAGEIRECLNIHGLEYHGTRSSAMMKIATSESQNLTWQMVWGAHPHLSNVPNVDKKTQPLAIDLDRQLNLDRAARLYISKAVAEIEKDGSGPIDTHLLSYLDWMQRSNVQANGHAVHESKHTEDDTNIANRIGQLGAEGELLARLGPRLADIVLQRVEPLELMLSGDLLFRVYQEMSAQAHMHLLEYVRRLNFQKPISNVLEVGAGTGATSSLVLQMLQEQGLSALQRYDFTDVSSGFFDSARSLLHRWHDVVNFKRYNIELEPSGQGLAPASYDLIIAVNVIHTTKRIDSTLRNLRKLLNPQGALVFIEITRPHLHVNLIFGTLPGWWQGVADGRTDGPLLPAEKWQALLRDNGYANEFAVKDGKGSAHLSTTIVARRTDELNNTSNQQVTLVLPPKIPHSLHVFAQKLQEALQRSSQNVSCTNWEDLQPTAQSIIIIIDDGSKPLLSHIGGTHFGQVIKLLSEGTKVLWISTQDDDNAAINPAKGLINGLARSAHAENSELRFLALDIQQNILSVEERALGLITRVIDEAFHHDSVDFSSIERELILRDDEVLVPRLLPSLQSDEWIRSSTNDIVTSTAGYGDPQNPLSISVPALEAGLGIVFDKDRTFESLPEPGCVDVAAEAWDLSYENATAFARRDFASLFGSCVGVVVRCGPNTKIPVGSHVCALTGTPYGSVSRVVESMVHTLPPRPTRSSSAITPIPYITACHVLENMLEIQKDQRVLIHNAKDRVGQAMIRLAAHKGINVFATTDDSDIAQKLCAQVGMATDHILPESPSEWTGSIEKFDIVINPTLREGMPNSIEYLSGDGTYLQVRDTIVPLKDDVMLFKKNCDYVSFNPVALWRKRPSLVASLFRQVIEILGEDFSQLDSNADTYPISDFDNALDNVQRGKIAACRLANNSHNASKVVTIAKKPTASLRANSTYIILGGLGDFGQKICRLLVQRGAEVIVNLSRQSPSTEAMTRLEHRLQSINSNARLLHIQCDGAISAQVRDAEATIRKMNLPPVRGIIHSASVLKDRILTNMTLEDFKQPLETKYHGTNHLEESFRSHPLDFYILLSSTVGVVGTSGQANYITGNVYQDMFVHSKPRSSCHYMSLNLGMTEGAAVNNSDRERALYRSGYVLTSAKELIAFLEYSLSAHARDTNCRQLVIGFNRKSIARIGPTNAHTSSTLFNHVKPTKDTVNTDCASIAQGNGQLKSESIPDADFGGDSVLAGLAGRLKGLVALPSEEISTQTPLSSFGMDSLIALELKNWITREYKATIQTSQILDAGSLVELAEAVKAKSPLLNASAEDSVTNGHKSIQTNQLPELPLPSLDGTLSFYVEQVEAMMTPKEREATRSLVRAFGSPDGLGPRLHEQLVERTKDPNIDCWQSEPYENLIYLAQRAPLYPFGIFYLGHPLPRPDCEQSERAAVIAQAAYRLKRQIEDETIETDYLNDNPLCMEASKYYFNANRVPRSGRDELLKYAGRDYVAVLHRGHVHQIALTYQSEPLSVAALKAAFDHVLTKSRNRTTAACTLSCGDRETWARAREELQELSPQNRTTIATIEESLATICLDEGSPSNASERTTHMYFSNFSNRWADKTIQFAVCENGASALLGEHTRIDGMGVRPLSRWMADAIHAYDQEAATAPPSEIINSTMIECCVQEHTLATNAGLDTLIKSIHDGFFKTMVPIDYLHHLTHAFGGDFLRAHKVPLKTGYHLVILLAMRIFYSGDQPETYETFSMARFRRGRVDWLQTVTLPMLDWTNSAMDPQATKADQKRAFFAAVRAHAKDVTRVTSGQGFRAHMYAMLGMLREGEETPGLFFDKGWEITAERTIKRVKLDYLEDLRASEINFYMPRDDCIFIHYEVKDDRCLYMLQTWPGLAQKLADALDQAALMVKEIVESDGYS